MSSVFTKIIDGELPGLFVWSDDRAVGFLSINPLGPGHTLVVPRQEVDQWVDADPDLLAHLTAVSHAIGAAVREVWQPPRVGVIVAGFEVPHLHVHVFPAWEMAAFDFANAAKSVEAAEQEAQAEKLRTALREAGHGEHVPDRAKLA
ncbi:HIT family protein [Pseudonocardia nigra]|uniref:HIT family protein n=1 Tax=Pseudonocardia nigra TaxID=1921578 RepID=UPI001C5E1CA2|nr:HIT family protein [Pseudonocardia nigra]